MSQRDSGRNELHEWVRTEFERIRNVNNNYTEWVSEKHVWERHGTIVWKEGFIRFPLTHWRTVAYIYVHHYCRIRQWGTTTTREPEYIDYVFTFDCVHQSKNKRSYGYSIYRYFIDENVCDQHRMHIHIVFQPEKLLFVDAVVSCCCCCCFDGVVCTNTHIRNIRPFRNLPCAQHTQKVCRQIGNRKSLVEKQINNRNSGLRQCDNVRASFLSSLAIFLVRALHKRHTLNLRLVAIVYNSIQSKIHLTEHVRIPFSGLHGSITNTPAAVQNTIYSRIERSRSVSIATIVCRFYLL